VKPADAGCESIPPRTTSGLGIEIQGGGAVVLIPEGSLPPSANARTFTTVADGQRALEIRVVRCAPGHRIAELIARFLLAGIRAGRRGEARIEIGMALDRGCGLRAWAAESESGVRQELFCSGLSAFPPDAGVKSLSRLLVHFSEDKRVLQAAGRAEVGAEIDEIAQWTRNSSVFAHAVTTGSRDGRRRARAYQTIGISASDSVAALHTLQGEIASLERSSFPPISASAEEPRTLSGRHPGLRRPDAELENVQ
jgi:hypothetical protein